MALPQTTIVIPALVIFLTVSNKTLITPFYNLLFFSDMLIFILSENRGFLINDIHISKENMEKIRGHWFFFDL